MNKQRIDVKTNVMVVAKWLSALRYNGKIVITFIQTTSNAMHAEMNLKMNGEQSVKIHWRHH